MVKKIEERNQYFDKDNTNNFKEDKVSYFMKKENVEMYKSALQDYDGSWVIERLSEHLSKGKDILELGMGTGLDYELMCENYNVLGTDSSPIFVEQYKTKNPYSNVMLLDAREIRLDKKFDCIFSNKVLHLLSKDDFIKSLGEQYNSLNDDGIIFMTLWHGEYNVYWLFDDTFRVTYYGVKDIENIVANQFNIVKIEMYTEIEDNDSLLVVLTKK